MSTAPTHFNDKLAYEKGVIGKLSNNALVIADKAASIARNVGYAEIIVEYEDGSKVKVIAK